MSDMPAVEPALNPMAGCDPCLSSLFLSTSVLTHSSGPLCSPLRMSHWPPLMTQLKLALNRNPPSAMYTTKSKLSIALFSHGLRFPVWVHCGAGGRRGEVGVGDQWQVQGKRWLLLDICIWGQKWSTGCWVKSLIWGFKIRPQGRDHESTGENEEIRFKDRSWGNLVQSPREKGQNKSQEPKEKTMKGNEKFNGLKSYKTLQQKGSKTQTNKPNLLKLLGREDPYQCQGLLVLTQESGDSLCPAKTVRPLTSHQLVSKWHSLSEPCSHTPAARPPSHNGHWVYAEEGPWAWH